jgi:CRISPR-associated protein Csb2
MALNLGLTIRFLDPSFHGRREGGQPEWPPSPLRVFQALVAAAASSKPGLLGGASGSALEWLESRPAPTVVAPSVHVGLPVRTAVPNNDLDLLATAWAKGREPKKQANELKTMKTVRPIWLRGASAVHYLWALEEPVSDELRRNLDTLIEIARSVTSLGWGIDLVVAHAAVLSAEAAGHVEGERWVPTEAHNAREALRVPVRGTLGGLRQRHQQFLDRLSPAGLSAPPPLTAHATVGYRRSTDSPALPAAFFSLLKMDAAGFRPFDTKRRALTVAGMMRYATKLAAIQAGWPEDKVNSFVLGHGESRESIGHVAVGPERFAFLPIPSIESRGPGKAVVGSVRRVAICTFATGCEGEAAWARRALSGQELIDVVTKQPDALLSLLPTTDRGVRPYVVRSASWATVTPVVLPGFDDPRHYRRRLRSVTSAAEQKDLLERLDDRVEGLLRKAIRHSGFSDILADNVELEWRRSGFWPGVDMADSYGVPDHLKRLPRFHVRLRWLDSRGEEVRVPGPICLGAGRFYGVGLFAAHSD